MKRAVLIVVCLLLLVIPAMGCVDDTAAPAKPLATQEFVNTQDNTIKSELKALIDARATMAYVDQRFAAVPASAGYTKAEIDALKVDLQSKITTLESKVTALEAKIAAVPVTPTTPTTPTSPTTPAGQISYTIQNPQSYYQFPAAGGILAFRIFNNTGTSKYIRPQISVSTFGSVSAGALVPATYSGNANAPPAQCIIQSNSLGQGILTFQYIATPASNVTSILFISNGGGAFGNGEYLLASGQAMDIYANIAITSATAALWITTVSGADRPIQ